MCENELRPSRLLKVIVLQPVNLVLVIGMFSHFRSHDKDGGHTIGSDIPKNAVLHANLVASCFIQPELSAIADGSCTLRD